MDTLTQVERLIELAIIQRSELRRLVEELPQLKAHLSEEIERTFEETEPQLRAELEEWTTKQAADKTAALGAALEAKIGDLAKSLEVSTQARYNAIIAEREENARLAAQAEAKIAEHAASLPGAVKEIVTAELARFPRAGEIDQLRKEFQEPRGLNPRGKWVAGESYNKLDLVTVNGDSYVSNIDGNTEKPSRNAANWTLNAARGISGGGGGITSLNDILGNPSTGDIVGSEGNNYVRKTLTAGDGIGITETPTTITIDASAAQQKLTATVKNAESFAITRGQVVYLFGATGNMASVKLASNTSDATSAKTFGVVSDASIAANGTGIITCVGVQDQLTLGAYNEGDTLYLGATAGSVTNVKPYAPNHLVYVGIVERANNGNGELYVKIQNGYELDEIHDVQINNPRQAGQTLIYDETNALWKNARLTAGVGVSITNADSSITISADGGVNYQGTWNASTNTPTLTSSVGTKGFYYVVSVAGSTNLNGVTDWQVGDWAIFNGSAWQKVDTTDQVSSVFGRTGAVAAVSTDYSSVGITNTAIGASNPSTGAFTTLSASTSLSGGASGLSIEAGGTNQNITLTPSGTGVVNSAFGSNLKLRTSLGTTNVGTARIGVWYNGYVSDADYSAIELAAAGTSGGDIRFFTTQSGFTLSQKAMLAENGNLLLGTTTDGGQKLQVNGTAAITGDVTITRASSGGGVGVRNVNTDSSGYASLSLNNSGGTAQSFDIGTGGSAVAITTLRQKLYIYDNTAGTTVMRLSGGSTSAVEFLGTGTHSFAGALTVSSSTASTSTTTGALVVTGGVGVGGAINAGGNLTVSGTGTSSVAGKLTLVGLEQTSTGSTGIQWKLYNSSLTSSNALSIGVGKSESSGNTAFFGWANNFGTPFAYINTYGGGSPLVLMNDGNNILVGHAVNGGNGRIQLATHTTSAGGIGFGTDVSLFRRNANSLALNATSGAPTLYFRDNSTETVTLASIGGDFYIATTAAKSILLQTNYTTALTLDSSQRAQFAGNIGLAAAPLANLGIRNSVSLTASGGSAYVYQSGGTLTTAANNDSIFGMLIDNGYSNAGSYTNVSAGHLSLNARSFSGVAFGYGLRIGNITGATSNYAIRTGSGIVSFEDTTDSTSTTTGALTVAGGLGVAKAIYGPSCIFPATGAVTLAPSDGYVYFRIGSTAYASWSLDGSTVQLYTESDSYKHIRLRPRSGGSTVINNAAIATTATDGFLYVPTCAGAPTGTPTTQTGTAPIVVDTTNNKLYFYSGGAWRDAGP